MTTSLVKGSSLDQEVAGSIPVTSSINKNVEYVWNGVHPASRGQVLAAGLRSRGSD